MSNYQEAIKTIDYPASAIAMYLDVKSDFFDMDSYKQFLACLSEVFTKDLVMKEALESYEKQKGSVTEKITWQFVEEASKESNRSIRKASKLFDGVYENLKTIMLHARQEVKKYES